MKYKNLMAKALYDNVPESPEELAFRKGDILTVIEQNTGGLEGWWLCSLHGRQGIAPGNRLKLLIGPMFEAQPSATAAAQSPPQSLQQTATSGAQGLYKQPQGIYQVPGGQDIYQVPPRSTLAAESTHSKVVTPVRVGQSYSYSPGQHNHQDLYDVPPSRSQGVYDIPPGQMFPGQPAAARNQGIYDVPPSQLEPRTQGVYDIPPSSQGVYSVPPCRTNADLQEGNYDFPQPLKQKQEGIYDVPPAILTKPSHSPQSLYDFPPNVEPHHHHPNTNGNEGIYDVPPSALHSGADSQQDVYDFPRGAQPLQNKGSADRDTSKGIYDIPAQDARTVTDVTDGVNRLSFSSTGSSRSSMSTSSSSTGCGSEGRLFLDVDAGVQRLYRLQQGVELSLGALHSMASSSHWRTFPYMEQHTNDVRMVLDKVRVSLVDFIAFGRGAAANATSLSDSSLHSKLRRQLARLEDSQQILVQTYQALESCSWALNALASSRQHHNKSDDLDRFVMVSRTISDDTKQLVSTIGSNAELLFRRTHADGTFSTGSTPEENRLTSLPSDSDSYSGQTKAFPVQPNQDKDNMNHSEKCVKSWMEDYDYVHLQGKEDFERQQKELLEKENIIKQTAVQLGQEQINQFKKLEQEVIKPVENDITQWTSPAPSDSSSAQVCARDRQLLGFYSAQCEQHFSTLLSAVDAFFACVGAGQPPRIFVAHSKFVILSAHKLVFIGDTLSRQASAPEVANRVMNSSNVLCDLLKTVVAATKTAALNYPNTAAIQDMVDRVANLSHHAQQFKEQLLQMAAL
ncbi:enhancer of filamentation 1 [Poecilia latipinna]|uniref:Breast cancer anti-estrogen resistance protein 1 n=2 Tax=Poecilia TaxID=8080 RepID=A0A087XIB5_POEFO|nr:PREDICTED: enhancer of filamentation 1 [Poecilia formosa]XP_014887045.1 PREDICTED: enhancer of filamentation 1 [Poecilia latipinna]